MTNKIDLGEWETFLNTQIKRHNTLKVYLDFIEELSNNNLPVIFELRHLSKLLGIDMTVLAGMITNSNKYYREFTIPKRKGGYRNISSPYPSLLYIQRWINKNILGTISLSDNSHGFIVGKSIITNASQHVNANTILKMDIENFFPSIRLNRIIKIFQNCGYPNNVSYYLASLCCLNNSLPQGAATSPTLSNIIFKRIDKRINGLATKWKLNYSRYADDLAFSGGYIPFKFKSIVSEILENEGFSINKKKTMLITKNSKKIITGISVATEKLCLPREKKRELRKEAYYLTKFGYFDHTKRIKVRDPIYLERLLGKLSFWQQVEPENKFVIDTIKKVNEIREELNNLI